MFIQLFTVHIHNFYFIGTFCLGLRGSETVRPPIITVQAAQSSVGVRRSSQHSGPGTRWNARSTATTAQWHKRKAPGRSLPLPSPDRRAFVDEVAPAGVG